MNKITNQIRRKQKGLSTLKTSNTLFIFHLPMFLRRKELDKQKPFISKYEVDTSNINKPNPYKTEEDYLQAVGRL